MAVSDEANQKLQEFIKKNSAKIEQGEVSSQVSPQAKDKEDLGGIDPEKSQINILKAKIKELEKDNQHQQEVINQTKELEEAKDGEKAERAVNDMIAGFNQDYFEKDYEFPMGDNKEPLKFHVKLRAATILDYGLIDQKLIQLTDGMVDYMHTETSNLLTALATLQVIAIEAPEWLKNGKSYNVAILGKVYADWKVWLETFRQYTK